MKLAIITDVHANLEALESVLLDAKRSGCERHVFLGDFVGYCADPKACVEIVRGLNAPCVKGNHDEYCVTNSLPEALNPRATAVVNWTRSQLSADDRQWLNSLPYVAGVEGLTIVHATLDSPALWTYAFDAFSASASLTCQETTVCFFGHTHVPVAFVKGASLKGSSFQKLKIEPGSKYFINPGSVGQPRDSDPRAAYVIYDWDGQTVELRRVEYDIASTQAKIRKVGLADL